MDISIIKYVALVGSTHLSVRTALLRRSQKLPGKIPGKCHGILLYTDITKVKAASKLLASRIAPLCQIYPLAKQSEEAGITPIMSCIRKYLLIPMYLTDGST
jgi:hypothetical protein